MGCTAGTDMGNTAGTNQNLVQPASSKPWVALQCADGTAARFDCNSTAGCFKHPVFLCKSAQLSGKQRKAQPVLLFSKSDWDFVSQPSTTHQGAFGADFDVLSTAFVQQRFVDGSAGSELQLWRQQQWVAVWKFPGDLNNLKGLLLSL